MSDFDIFKTKIKGKGGHAAMPQTTIDSIIIGTKIIETFQATVSGSNNPQEPQVFRVTQFHEGDAYNVIPNEADIKCCTRCFSAQVQEQFELEMSRIAENICQAYEAEGEFIYERRYPATIKSEEETSMAGRVAQSIVGEDHVNLSPQPSMGSEDFAYILQEKLGSYIWIGNGDGSCMIYNPRYDFKDEILPLEATDWVKMPEEILEPNI